MYESWISSTLFIYLNLAVMFPNNFIMIMIY